MERWNPVNQTRCLELSIIDICLKGWTEARAIIVERHTSAPTTSHHQGFDFDSNASIGFRKTASVI